MLPGRFRLLFIAALLALGHAGAGQAGMDRAGKGTFGILFENDLFAGTDADYTSGVQLNWVSPDLTRYRDSKRIPRWAVPLIARLPFIHEPGLQRNVGIGLAQKIYTPRDISARDLQEDDRPYAGWLYLSTAFHNRNIHRLDTMEVQLGLIGPLALGEQAQNGIHRLRGLDEAKGWRNQLDNELAWALVYEHKNRWPVKNRTSPLDGDLITHYGGAVGTVFTYLNAGLEARFGWNLPADFGTALIRPGSDANAPLDTAIPHKGISDRFSLFGFGAFTGRLVLHDIFLDGNTFTGSHRIDKKALVGDLIFGVGMTLRGWKVTYSRVFRSREFKNQPDRHNFGSVSLSWTF